jgi:hypothetical protein
MMNEGFMWLRSKYPSALAASRSERAIESRSVLRVGSWLSLSAAWFLEAVAVIVQHHLRTGKRPLPSALTISCTRRLGALALFQTLGARRA